jgi:hypothetical protein
MLQEISSGILAVFSAQLKLNWPELSRFRIQHLIFSGNKFPGKAG